jgi:hypothetical protein
MTMWVARWTSRSRPFKRAEGGGYDGKAPGVGNTTREEPVEFLLERDDPGAKGHRLVQHAAAQALGHRPLRARQAEGVCVLQHMHGARVTIQFGRQRQRHATRGKQAGHVLRGQGL